MIQNNIIDDFNSGISIDGAWSNEIRDNNIKVSNYGVYANNSYGSILLKIILLTSIYRGRLVDLFN